MTKENLEKKLITVEEQISNLLSKRSLEYQKEKKKLDVKSYLENFYRDKKECENFVDTLEKETAVREQLKEERMKKENEKQNAMDEKIKETQKNKIEQRRIENKEIFKKMSERNNKIKREISDSLLRKEEKIKHNYLYNIMEDKYKQKVTEYEENQRNEFEKLLNKRKDFYKIKIRKSELDEHSEKVESIKKEKLLKMEKERLLQLEIIKSENLKLEQKKEVSKFHLDVLKINQEIKQRDEKIKVENLHNSLKVKKYSEFLKEHIPIHTDELKKKELKDRVERLDNPRSAVKHHYEYKKNNFIKFVKFNENSKKKYKWDVDLKKSAESLKAISSKPGSSKESDKIAHTEGNRNLSTVEIRKPLEKRPNYLSVFKNEKDADRLETDMNLNQKYTKKWGNILKKIDNIYSSIEEVKFKTQSIEENAFLKEKFLIVHGGAGKHPKVGMEVSELLINSIQAKLLLIEKINSLNN